MVYEAFLEAIVKHFQMEFGEEYQISMRRIPKNNGVTLDSLCISKSDLPMSPAIYLNAYYDQYLAGMSLDAIIYDIRNLYYGTSIPEAIKMADLTDFEALKPSIMFKLIHAASNEKLLEEIPHISYLDMAIIFYLYLDHSASGQMTALIHNDHIKRWGVRTKDLWQCALCNTPQNFPAQICSMEDMIKEIARQTLGSRYDEETMITLLEEDGHISPLYVLTNPDGINGACCMLYRNVLKDFADSIEADLIILPSSIHEVLITPNHPRASYEELSSMVTLINQNEISPEDQLSNQVYLYTRADDRIRIVSHGPEKVGAASGH
ncbi:MAG: DUF5688 family protein [Brotaphodocola sp.]